MKKRPVRWYVGDPGMYKDANKTILTIMIVIMIIVIIVILISIVTPSILERSLRHVQGRAPAARQPARIPANDIIGNKSQFYDNKTILTIMIVIRIIVIIIILISIATPLI